MTVEYFDLVEDYTATAGTGPFTLYNEVITHRQRPASVLSIGDQWPCVITHTTLNEWQTGTATYLGSNQFEITTPRDGSSGSGVRVSFSAGLKTVRLDVIAHHILDNVAATATSASNASTSASNAATSATAASSSATAAAASASAASTSASNAASSASAASTSATNAATSAAIAANAAGFTFTYSTTTTMADPGTGVVRFNSGTLASVTSIAIDDLAADSGNPDVSAWIGTFNDSSNGTTKGLLRLRKSTAAQNYVDYSVTGLVDNSGWTELTVTYIGSNGTLSNGDSLLTAFYQTGDKGADGVGAGDVLGPASTTDGVIALWNGTSGDLLKQATTTGIIKAISGVMSAATGADVAAALSGQTISAATVNASSVMRVGATASVGSEKSLVYGSQNSSIHALVRNDDAGSSAYAGCWFNAYGNSWAFRVGSAAANSNKFVFTSDILGAATNQMELSTAGALRLNAYGAGTLSTDSSGNVTSSSDEALKEAIAPFTRGLTDILGIAPISYNWNALSGLDRMNRYHGFSAQNVEVAIPEAVGVASDGFLTLQDRPILAALVNAVKTLSEQNAALAARIATLEGA